MDKPIPRITIERIEDLNCPFFHCTECGKKIDKKDGKLTNVLWDPDQPASIVVLHKACDQRREPYRSWMWMDLDMFLMSLMHNSGLTTADLDAAEDLWKMFP